MIGRKYLTTTRELLQLQNLFTVDFQKITFFQLGQPKNVADVPSADITHYYAPIKSFDELTEQGKKNQQMILVLVEDAAEMRAAIEKLSERLKIIEQQTNLTVESRNPSDHPKKRVRRK